MCVENFRFARNTYIIYSDQGKPDEVRKTTIGKGMDGADYKYVIDSTNNLISVLAGKNQQGYYQPMKGPFTHIKNWFIV